MLVIMHNRNFHALLQRLLDDETFGCLDIFKVDPPEAGLKQGNGIDEGVRVLRRKFKINRVDIGKALQTDWRLIWNR